MAKFALKLKAFAMRRNGSSIRDITRSLRVSKASASLWCKDIPLSEKQIEKLHQNMLAGSYRGRLKGALIQKERKLRTIQKYEEEGLKKLGKISNRDLLLVGLGLHLGEGTKGGGRVRFTNSNSLIVKLFIAWIEKAFGVSRSQIYCRVMINEIHKKREAIVVKEWSKILKIPLSQFEKTTFIKAKVKKVYENYNSFLGTLSITILKSSDLQYRILGLMKGLVYKICEEKEPG